MIVISEDLTFHLSTKKSSYVMKVLESGHLGTLHYGARIRKSNYINLNQNFSIIVGGTTQYSEDIEDFSLDVTPTEIATYGKGDYKEPSLSMLFHNNSRTCDLTYKSHDIYKGKKNASFLPGLHGDEDSVESLVVTMEDPLMGVEVQLHYSVFEDVDVITRYMTVINKGQELMSIEKAMSMNLDFRYANYHVLTLDGKWIRERHMNERKLSEGTFSIDSKKGVSSANHNPFLGLMEEHTTETQGNCYGFGLVYSGNHQCLLEVNPHYITRVQLGINPFDFQWQLEAGQSFQTPEVVMSFSKEGLNGLSQHFHDAINKHLIPEQWQYKERPVLLNNWEATYFDFDEKKLVKLAKKAVDLGIELFVLDDGWFGNRTDDTKGLGDWYENMKRLPKGLEGLSKKIHDLGLSFGLWVEPEMVNEDSELYRNHPDWVIRLPERKPSLGRHQLMLDLSNPEVVNHLYDVLEDIFRRSDLQYVKWDMNRNISDVYSSYLPKNQQKELTHRYVLGLYNLLGRLTKAFPDILFESCASGGNRFDLGMLYYMPQTWTSDNTDAIERIKIQYGTSMVYPLSTMGAHVSSSPSHQVLRNTPLETRFNVAAFGVLGYELDITHLTSFEEKLIKKQVAFYKEHRRLLQFGRFFRLASPFRENESYWMVVSPSKEEALIGYYQSLQESSPGMEYIRLEGLDEEVCYGLVTRQQYMNIRKFGELINEVAPIHVPINGTIHNAICNHMTFEAETEKVEAYGDELMYVGFLPSNQYMGTGYNKDIRIIGDFGSRMYYIKAKQ